MKWIHPGKLVPAFSVVLTAWLVLGTFATPAGSAGPAFGDSGLLPESVGELVMFPAVTLDPISAEELSWERGAATVDLDSWRGLRALEVPPLRTELTRRLPSLWRLRIDDRARPESLEVSYEVVAANGRSDRLSHVERPESEIGAVAEPLWPVVIDRDADTAVLEGGLVLRLSIDEIRYSGTYSGTITVSLHHL